MTAVQDQTEEGQPSSAKASKSFHLHLVGFGLILGFSAKMTVSLAVTHLPQAEDSV